VCSFAANYGGLVQHCRETARAAPWYYGCTNAEIAMRASVDRSVGGQRTRQERIRLVLADDHEIVRVGLRHLLGRSDRIELVAEARTGEEAVALVRHHRPDVVLLDIVMPQMNGIEAARIIRTAMPSVRVVMLTSYEDSFHIEQALRAGAHGYLTKNMAPEELLEAIEATVAGEQVFSPTILDFLPEVRQRVLVPGQEPLVRLTAQECRVLRLIAQGMTSKEIAKQLGISPRTVETHRAHLMEKLHVHNVAALVRFALFNMEYLERVARGGE
jgi:two-component system response regulator NreC